MPLAVTKFFDTLPIFWKLSVIRCIVYMFSVGWLSFITGVEGYEKYSDMTSMQHVKLFGGIVAAMVGTLLAFLDNTIQKVAPKEDSVTVTQTKQTEVTQTHNT